MSARITNSLGGMLGSYNPLLLIVIIRTVNVPQIKQTNKYYPNTPYSPTHKHFRTTYYSHLLVISTTLEICTQIQTVLLFWLEFHNISVPTPARIHRLGRTQQPGRQWTNRKRTSCRKH